jgi:hypothetical protein
MVNIWQESGDDAMRVVIDGVPFSYRTFTVRRGTITPTRPSNVHAKRTAAYRGRVGFDLSTPRRARITGYQARCAAVSGTHVVWATASGSPIVVTGLHQGRAYSCAVRAQSRAGASRWSSAVRMPRYPS